MKSHILGRILFIVGLGMGLSVLITASSSVVQAAVGPRVNQDALGLSPISYKLLSLTNADRRYERLPPLKLNNVLEHSAKLKCDDILAKNYWGHISPQGKNVADYIYLAGLKSLSKAGENLAIGQHSAAEVNTAWMNSPSHRDAILSNEYTDVGFATCVYKSNVPGLESMNIYIEHFLVK